MKSHFLWLLLFLLGKGVSAQNTIALPEIINYPKQAYNAGMQNWKIGQDKLGILYFANNDGLLSFDGNIWKKYSLPDLKRVRALGVADDGKIYIGGQGEIGFFEPGTNGILQYHNLTNLVAEKENDFTDIWEVIPIGTEVFFRSYKRILHLKQGKIAVYTNTSWTFLGLCNGQLIGRDFKKGLLIYTNGQWKPFVRNDILPPKAQVCAIMPIGKDSSLLITKKEGFYLMTDGKLLPYKNADIQEIADKNPYAATAVRKNEIAIATSLGGCFVINYKGEIVQRLTRQDGLQNNNVLCVFADKNQNLWLGLDNGIDFVAYNSAIKHIYADYQEHSSGKSAIIYHNHLYIGTSNGLYKAAIQPTADISLVKSSFELIPNIKGQVWNLTEINGNLLAGHNDGFYLVKDNNTTEVIDGSTGFWNFTLANTSTPSQLLVAGTYNGLNFYHYENGKFINPSVHSHFESARNLAIEGNIAWAVHPYKGLFKIMLNGGINPTNTPYKDKKGILASDNNHLFKIRNRIVLTNDKGFFEYNAKTDDFEPSTYFTNLLPERPVQYLKEDAAGNLWFIHNKQLGVVDFSKAKPQVIHFPELNEKIKGTEFDFIYPYNSQNVFVSGEEGFYHINYEAYKKAREVVPIYISSVRINNERDSTLYGGYNSKQTNSSTPEIAYAWNSLHFDFSSSLYGKQPAVEYAYMLSDFDKSWSAWTKKTEKEYTYLPPGSYTFKVKARTSLGEESVVSSYHFIITPPWYRSGWAYLVYCILFAFAVYGVHRFQVRKFTAQRKKHEEERKRLEYLNTLQAQKHEDEQKQLMYVHQLELERNEKEIIRLRNEKLESEIQIKNSELATTSFNLIQKGEMLVKVKEEFVRMKKTNEVDKESDDYKKIIKMLGEDKMKKDWEQFALHFDKVHSDFLVTLKSQYANLTPSELKLCAYLRLNLSSKEIAQIMNISIKSVELARYRLRKKLQMQPEENLFNFLLNFHSEAVTKSQ